MNTSHHRASGQQGNRSFKFFITGGSVSRATATILAKDLDIARNMANALFPGADISEHELGHADRH